MQVENFIVDLHRGSRSIKKMKRLADGSFGDKLLKARMIY
jgi:hypothetical protein